MEVAWTIFGTVISGVIVYVICEYIQETSLRRVREYQDIKRRIAYVLTMYACHYTNTIDIAKSGEQRIKVYREESEDMRKAACELRAFCETLPDKVVLFKKQIPPKKDLLEASGLMIGISNSFFHSDDDCGGVSYGVTNGKWRDEIQKKLKLNSEPEQSGNEVEDETKV